MREDNITKIFSAIEKVGSIKLHREDIRDSSVNIEKFEKYFNNLSIEKFYSRIYSEFENLIYIKLENNCDIKLLEKFNNSAKTIFNNGISKYNFKLNSTGFQKQNFTDEEKKKYYLFRKIQTHQTLNMNKIIKLLEHEIEYFEYRSNENLTINSSNTIDTHNILKKSIPHEKKDNKNSFNSINKATFNLSKTDSIMFIYMLEKCNLIKFESTSHRNSFIENNFNYSELRNINSENKELQMKGINSDFANIKSNDKESLKRFNKNLESLKDKLQIIMDFKLES